MINLARQFATNPEVRYGMTALCIGIGMGGTVIWENPLHEAAQDAHAANEVAA
jgi:acetyl-CoA acyltransferase